MKNRRFSISKRLLGGMLFCFAAIAAAGQVPLDRAIGEKESGEIFDKALRLIVAKFYRADLNGLSADALRSEFRPRAVAAKDKFELERVLGEMCRRFGVSHLYVKHNIELDKKEIATFSDGRKFDDKKFRIGFGFGFQMRTIEERLVVTDVEENSSASAAGVERGWVLRAVGGEAASPSLAVFRRDGQTSAEFVFVDVAGAEHRLTLARKFFLYPRRPDRERRTLPGGFVYLRFASFDNDARDWFVKAIAESVDAPGVIVDLRGNSGGYVTVWEAMLSRLLPENSRVGYFIERDTDQKPILVGAKNSYTGKIAVIVDERSESASEIFAATIQDLRRGVVVGAKTAGNVMNSLEYGLPSDFKIQIPVRDFITGRGRRLEGNGVEPDVKLAPTLADFRAGRDPVLDAARRRLEMSSLIQLNGFR